MNTPVKICLASALALATALPALAQGYYGAPYQPTQQYRDDAARYENDRAAYENRRDDYDASRAAYDNRSADYRAARADYERRHADWVQARADYDARYGYGAYVRVYGAEPVWDEARWSYVAPSPSATYYGRDSAYTAGAGCRPANNNNAVAGGILGALAGAALGSNVAANGRGTEGAVLGAVVGGALGASVGNASSKYQCDQRGPYYSYNNTIAYREDRRFRSGNNDYAYYTRMRCRLAAAPIDNYGRDYRYVRVCPDASGRYRITG
jgi:hypothetical protein